MGRDLTNLHISESFQYLLQVSGSEVNDGLGVDVDSLNLDIVGTASTASYVAAADVDGTVANATSASFASTASLALELEGGVSLQSVLDTGNTATASIDLDGAINATNVTASFQGDLEGTAATASYVESAQSASYIPGANVDGNVTGSNKVTLTNTAANSNFGIPLVDSTDAGGNTDLLVSTENSLLFNPSTKVFTFADNADIESSGDVNIQGNLTASNASFTSASIGFLESVTGSAKIIGDAFIILNNNTPTERYAGVVVQDSGSTNNTASLEFDGQTNDWFYEYTDDGGVTAEHGVVLFGPGYNTKGAHVYPSNNTILKGTGDHHVVDSSITDDGTLVSIDSDVSASGYISASAFVGDGSALTGVAGLALGDTATSLASALTTNVASAQGAGDVAIGDGAVARGGDAVSIGKDANASSNDAQAVAIGSEADASFSCLALGYRADASNFGIAIGGFTSNQGGISIGRAAQGNNSNILAIGGDARVDGARGIALGNQARTDNDNSIALGYLAKATGSLALSVKINDADLMTATTASQDVTFAGAVTASAFSGDGSGLTGVDGFPFSGSASISGSLEVQMDDVDVAVTVIDGDATGSLVDNLHPTIASSSAQVNHIVTIEQDQYDAITPDENTFYIISDATDEVLPGNLEVSGQIYSPTSAVSVASSTASIDWNDSNFQTLDASAGSIHIDAPTNIKSGTTYTLVITSGSGITGYDSTFKFSEGTAPTFSGGTDILTMVSDGTNLYGTGLANFS